MCQEEYEGALQRTQLPTIWAVPDPMWDQIRDLLPPEKEAGTPGRPPVPFRKVLDGILFVLRTGCHWNAVPEKYGSGSTVHRRFQQWVQAGILDAIIELMLDWYDQRHGIDWEWQAGDTKLFPAPLGGEKTGPNPTDLGKCGSKRHLLVDGNGAPLALHVSAANQHDVKGVTALLDTAMMVTRPKPTDDAPQHICLDTAYDAEDIDAFLGDLDYITHIKRRNETDEPGVGEPIHPPRRWNPARESVRFLGSTTCANCAPAGKRRPTIIVRCGYSPLPSSFIDS